MCSLSKSPCKNAGCKFGTGDNLTNVPGYVHTGIDQDGKQREFIDCGFPEGPKTKEQKNIEESGMARCGETIGYTSDKKEVYPPPTYRTFPCVRVGRHEYAVVDLSDNKYFEVDGAVFIRWTDWDGIESAKG